MTKLAATLGISASTAGLLLLAFQMLPPKENGVAQAGTEPAAPVRAWADPPRATTAAAPLERSAGHASIMTEAIPPAPPTVRYPARSDAGRTARSVRERLRVIARMRRPQPMRVTTSAAVRSAPQPVRTSPVRMAGPVGDILHGLGLD